MQPTVGHGKICYIVIPATDVAVSSRFYEKVFAWELRERGNGDVAFNDGVGQVSGTWALARPPVDAGSMIYIMTDDIRRTCLSVVENGGSIVQEADATAREVVAQFRDPGGNVFGIYEQRGL